MILVVILQFYMILTILLANLTDFDNDLNGSVYLERKIVRFYGLNYDFNNIGLD